MKKELPKRIVRLEEGQWRISSDQGPLNASEQEELKDYFDEIRFPYRMFDGRPCVPPCVPETVSWETIFERLEFFYDGQAEVYPF